MAMSSDNRRRRNTRRGVGVASCLLLMLGCGTFAVMAGAGSLYDFDNGANLITQLCAPTCVTHTQTSAELDDGSADLATAGEDGKIYYEGAETAEDVVPYLPSCSAIVDGMEPKPASTNVAISFAFA